MKLTLILGPMKSGKSFELINYFAPLKYTKQNFALFYPASNVRDEQINSRNGVYIESVKIQTIKNLIDGDYVIAINQIFDGLYLDGFNIHSVAGIDLFVADI